MSQIESLLQVRSKPRSRRKWFQPDFNSRELHEEAPGRQLRSRSAGQSLQEVTVIVMKLRVAFDAVLLPTNPHSTGFQVLMFLSWNAGS